jgi:hypothetical protein
MSKSLVFFFRTDGLMECRMMGPSSERLMGVAFVPECESMPPKVGLKPHF